MDLRGGTTLQAPFPYFGGKRTIAQQVWTCLGEVENYIEPFFGSGAVLRQAPWPSPRLETANDADGLVSNAWRALQANPEAVAAYADWPVNENDLHARHAWLVRQKASLQARLEGDPFWYDAQAAGWWIWGMSCWIGSGFCSGKGPWQVVEGELQRIQTGEGPGVERKRPHLSHAGNGVHATAPQKALRPWFRALAARLRRVRVCCGDWTRVLGPSVTVSNGLTGIFFDPPYSADRNPRLYTHDSLTVAQDVQAWCLEQGHNPLLRLVLCGYGAEHDVLLAQGWHKWTWKAHGGYGNQGTGRGRANAAREACWVSPHCVQTRQLALFEASTPGGPP